MVEQSYGLVYRTIGYEFWLFFITFRIFSFIAFVILNLDSPMALGLVFTIFYGQ
jgi:hypothetical protein